MNRGLPLFILLLFTSCAIRTEYDVTVSAGQFDRRHVPVSAELDLPVTQPETPVCVEADDGFRRPGQIERIDRQRAYVWWTMEELASGSSRSFTIKVGDRCHEAQFDWKEVDSMRTNLTYNGTPVLQYVHPTFDSTDIEGTKKPFHHVYAPDGSRKITKGFGGLYPHHRGIHYGYSEIQVDSQILNTWAASEGEHQQHQEVAEVREGPVFGGHTVVINWNDRRAQPFIEETRTLRAFQQPAGRTLLEFESTLRTLRGPITLEGDRQHAGVQFRASQEVADNQEATRYLRPADWSHLPADEEVNDAQHTDLPWNAVQFSVDGTAYSVAYLTDPENPEGARFSERLYGRFGEYLPHRLTEEAPLTLRYRFLVDAGGDISREEIAQYYQHFQSPVTVDQSD